MALKIFIPASSVLAATLLISLPARGGESDLDALDLKITSVEPSASSPKSTKLFLEGALGSAEQRSIGGSRSLRRASVDFFHSSRPAPGWRAVVSNRLDHIRPSDPGGDDTINSLREAYLGWESDSGSAAIEFGRINIRQGPGYGFNPTDFFRDGALRDATTVNPFAVRENRLGTVVVRAQSLWQGGSLSLALAPKLADGPSREGSSLDLGATNSRNRILLTASQKLTERVSGQALLYKEPSLDAQVGASLTALLSDAVVAHAEWAHAREPGLIDRFNGALDRVSSGNRFAGGLTYTTASKLSITAEAQFNSFGLSKSEWTNIGAAAGPAVLGGYLLEAERRQDLAARQSVLIYATQKSAGLKNLDLTAFLRINAHDDSHLSWLELRYHWSNTDIALQWQRNSGKPLSQYGLNRESQILQLVTTVHFQ